MSINERLPFVPRVGLELVLPGELEHLTWYGRGPHENYVDRKKGAAVGCTGALSPSSSRPTSNPPNVGAKRTCAGSR